MPAFNNPDDRDSNRFRWYVGRVAENKAADSRDIEVTLTELSAQITGPIESNIVSETVESEDHNGVKRSDTVKTAKSVPATWAGEPNRDIPPDVVKGETVNVFQYGDSPTYYWMATGRTDDLRKTDRWRVIVADSPVTSKVLSDENTYGITMNTADQYLRLHTSKGTDEKFAYEIMIDGRSSVLRYQDDVGNGVEIDSENTKITLTNKNGTTLILDKNNILLLAIDDIVLKAGRQLVLNTPVITSENTVGSGVTELNSTGLAINSQNFTVQASTIGLNGATKVAGGLVAGSVRAAGYSTGGLGGAYQPASSNIKKGEGTSPTNTPDNGSGTGDNRHCAAQEDTHKAFAEVVAAIHILEREVGVSTNIDNAVTHSQDSVMPKNQGE